MKKHKIIFLATHQWQIDDLWEPKAKKMVKKYAFDVEVHLRNELNDSKIKQVLKNCDGLITTWGSPICSEKFIKNNAPNLKIIGHAAGSVVAVCDKSTFKTGIKVISANSVMAESVAEWSLLATLLGIRNFGAYTAWHGTGKMDFINPFNMSDIQKSTIGIWGLGDISKNLIRMLAPLKPGRILVASNYASEEYINCLGAEKKGLEYILRESDVFHALTGVNRKNYERIAENEFAMLKDGAVFVNCGRARLTKESALLEALKSKRISAILDVFHEEPLQGNSELYNLDNVIMTPHNAGFPGRDRFIPFLLEEFNNFFGKHECKLDISQERFSAMTNEHLCCSI
jgi:phosphoglycerate dehydrogenase-like enzyme